MNYKSTRSGETTSAKEALLRGMTGDGGLYVPLELPKIDYNSLRGLSYGAMAKEILTPFFEDLGDLNFIEKIYSEKFPDDIAPIKSIGNNYFLELYHGASHAFKDFALSLLPEFLNRSMPDDIKKIRVICATSGDTGSATLKAFKNVENSEALVFYPFDKVSEIQEMQMLSTRADNIRAFAINGNFDECQMEVKKVFADSNLRERLKIEGVLLSSANSINIGRLLPQICYYFYAYLKLSDMGEIAPGERIDVAVPTGNFGDILAGYYAKKMSLPISRLISASNENDVLSIFFKTGKYIKKEFKHTISPSMDILISSNLERLLYHESSEGEVSRMMEDLNNHGEFEFKGDFKDFTGEMAYESETYDAIGEVFQNFNYLIDPHTAVAYSALKKLNSDKKTLIISTASPFKFPGTMIKALGGDENSDNPILELENISKIKAEDLKGNFISPDKSYELKDIKEISERRL